MVFASPIFLFLFLPLVLAAYASSRRAAERGSARREPRVLRVGRGLVRGARPGVRPLQLGIGVAIGGASDPLRGGAGSRPPSPQPAALAMFKYANFAVANVNTLAPVPAVTPLALAAIPLPLGISFFTFHAISYVVDVYKRNAQRRAQPAALRALHPAVSAADRRPDHPLARHRRADARRASSALADFAYGVRRFVLGLGKKVLIANTLGRTADRIFALPAAELTTPLAWLGLVCYTLQIYFDFSGYSDMAIGLMRMFGFRILENFNYPYISRSIREFWRRWHISLSNWFRDYLYIPLGGNQRGERARVRQPRDRVPAVRALARRELAVRAVGRVARASSWSPSAPASIACCARIGRSRTSTRCWW